jgi:hypothetical protein
MPIKAENRALYPSNWPSISRQVRERAKYFCEQCGLRNYSVGYRDEAGRFSPLAGSGPCDCAGVGLQWPSMTPITYREAREFAQVANTESDGRDADGNRWFVIVLTVAHLDHDPRNCELSNLKALCQYCHLHYDQEHHAETAYETRRNGKAAADLFPMGHRERLVSDEPS